MSRPAVPNTEPEAVVSVDTLNADLATLRQGLKARQRGTGSTKNTLPALAALDRVEAEIARLERELDEARREKWSERGIMLDLQARAEAAEAEIARLESLANIQHWRRAEAAEAEVERLRAELELRKESGMSDEAWVPTYEKVKPHSLCCAECKKAREEAARLRDGLREIADMLTTNGDPYAKARALLAEEAR